MLEFRDSFVCITDFTLTGKKVLIGLRNYNVYVQVKKEQEVCFFDLLKQINEGKVNDIEHLSGRKHELAKELYSRGFFVDSVIPKPAFNEVSAFSKDLLKKDFCYAPKKKEKPRIFINLCLFMVIAVLFLLVIAHKDILYSEINFKDSSILDIIICMTIIPFFVYFLHEFGHFVIAIMLDVPVASFKLSFFIIYLMPYLTYRGLNLYSNRKKICVLLGGVAGHAFGLLLGMLLYNAFSDSFIIKIWNLAHFSMIISNLSIFGVSDGYFIFSNLFGIYNLRLLGYRGLNKLMNNVIPSRKEFGFAILILLLWVISFKGVYSSLSVYRAVFQIPGELLNTICTTILILLVVRFVYKIVRMDFPWNRFAKKIS